MDEERERRIAQNEALFRTANESIEDLNRAFGTITERAQWVCECGRATCTERVDLPLEAYERVRESPARFLLKPGHEITDVEHVVERHEAWLVVEKDPGTGRRVAVASDDG